MVSKEEFKNYLEGLVTPEDKRIIEKSIQKNKSISNVCFVLGAIFFVMAVLFIAFSEFLSMFAMALIPFSLVAVIFGLILRVYKPQNSYLEKKYKTQVVNFLLNGYEHKYSEKESLKRSDFKASKACGHYDTFKGEDLLSISFNKNGNNFRMIMSDCEATEVSTDDDGNTTETTVYNGIVGFIEFDKELNCKLAINNRGYSFSKPMRKISLEDIDFNKKFIIYADDAVEAVYLLTPTLMQKLKEIHKVFKFIGFVFDGNRMYFYMPNNRLFVTKTCEEDSFSNIFENFYDDIKNMLSIGEEISSNKRIFKR